MTTMDTSPADILDFRLLDEAGHPALNIEEEGRSNLLQLQIENVSGQRLTFPKASQGRAQKGEHHFSLSFRPGALSDQTLARLTETDPPMDLLGPKVSGWDVRVERTRRPIDPVTLYFLYTKAGNTPSLAASGNDAESTFTMQLCNIAASPGNGVRPSAAQLGISRMHVGNRLDNWFQFQRRAELYITHAGGGSSASLHAGPPLRLDLMNDLVIPAGHNSKTVHLVLSNSSPDIIIEGKSVDLVMDIGEEDRWWALAARGELIHADYATLIATPVGGRERLESPLRYVGTQDVPNTLHFEIRLPNGQLKPGHSIDLRLSLKTSRSGPLAIHIVSDLSHFGHNRQTFFFPRLGFTLGQLGSDTRTLGNRTNSIEATLRPLPGQVATATQQLAGHVQLIQSLEAEVASLKKNFQAQIGGLATTTRFFLRESIQAQTFHCDPSTSTLKTKNSKLESVTMKLDFYPGNEGVWGVRPTFSGSIILEQSPQPKGGAYLHFPADKQGIHAYAGYWYYNTVGLVFEYEPVSRRLYYHGQIHGIGISEIPDHAPQWITTMGGTAEWNRQYQAAKDKFLENVRWTTIQSSIQLSSLQGPY